MKTVCALVAAIGASMAAAEPAITTIGNGSESGSFNGEYGWTFNVRAEITITHLGVWDARGDGLEQPGSTVRVWTGPGDVLATATLGANNPGDLIDGFRYIDIDDITLTPDDGVITISVNNVFGSGQTVFQANGNGLETAGAINLLSAVGAFNPGQFPQQPAPNLAAYLGPNFMFIPAAPTLAVCLPVLLGSHRRTR